MKGEREKYLAYRVRVLPGQLDAARRKHVALAREAIRIGYRDLLTPEEIRDAERP